MADNSLKTPFVFSAPTMANKAAQQLLNLVGKSAPASVTEIDNTGTIVKVKLELDTGDQNIPLPIIQCPVLGPEYVRWPIQKGDKGIVFSSDYYLGGMSGLGGGIATLDQLPNLSTLVFYPIGNTNFSATEDPNKLVLYGIDGVILKGCNDDMKSTDPDVPAIGSRANVPTVPDCGRIDANRNNVALSFGNNTLMTADDTGFKFYIGGHLTFVIDSAGARFIGGPMPDGGNFGVNVTSGGTYIDGVNFLPHQHVGVQTGPNNTGAVDVPPP